MNERTLLDLANESSSAMQQLLIKTIVDTSGIWNVIPFQNKPTGKSMFDQENVLPNPQIQDFNANINADTYQPNKNIDVRLHKLASKVSIDSMLKEFFEAENPGQSYEIKELQKYARAMALNLKRFMIENPSFGLDQWIAEYAGSVNLVNSFDFGGNPISTNLLAFTNIINEALNEGNGIDNAVIITNQTILNQLQAESLVTAQNNALATYFRWESYSDEQGISRLTRAFWNGTPMIALGKDSQRQEILDFSFGGNDSTKIYIANMGNEQVSMLQNKLPEVRMNTADGVIENLLIQWAVSLQAADPRSLRRITGVTAS
jgi:hypothetical protein